jgi:hypothetical protein
MRFLWDSRNPYAIRQLSSESIGKNENVAEKDADRGFDQRLYLVGQDRLEAGSRRALSGLWICRPKRPG